MVLSYHSDFHPELANLYERLRYLLGGDRPSQTTHQALFPVWYLNSFLQRDYLLNIIKTCSGIALQNSRCDQACIININTNITIDINCEIYYYTLKSPL